jgi:hypothetical protein
MEILTISRGEPGPQDHIKEMSSFVIAQARSLPNISDTIAARISGVGVHLNSCS